MSTPNNDLRTPQTFRAPIPRSPAVNFLTVVEEDGTEWCESYGPTRPEAKEDDEEILKAQIAYDEMLVKEKEKEMLEAYKAKLFRNVLGTPVTLGTPKGKK